MMLHLKEVVTTNVLCHFMTLSVTVAYIKDFDERLKYVAVKRLQGCRVIHNRAVNIRNWAVLPNDCLIALQAEMLI